MNDVMLTIVGNVIADPEAGTTRGGAPFASFRVASSSRRFDQQTQSWVNADTLYLQVRCWRGLALNVAGTLQKGSPVVVQGRLVTRAFVVDGPQGEQRRSSTELMAVAVGLDLGRLPVSVSTSDTGSDAGAVTGIELAEFTAMEPVAA